MAIDVLVDTSLFIEHTRQPIGISPLSGAIKSYHYRALAVSFVTTFEYNVGEVRVGREPGFAGHFPEYSVIALSDSIWRHGLYIQKYSVERNARMELADLLIASTAITKRVPLLTLNFDHFKHLQLYPHRPLRLPKVP